MQRQKVFNRGNGDAVRITVWLDAPQLAGGVIWRFEAHVKRAGRVEFEPVVRATDAALRNLRDSQKRQFLQAAALRIATEAEVQEVLDMFYADIRPVVEGEDVVTH